MSNGEPRVASRQSRNEPVTVLLADGDRDLERVLTGAGFHAVAIQFTPFDGAGAATVNHFETYNRTPASQRVADIVSALRAHPGAALVADGDGALPALLASAVVPVPVAVLDVGRFDSASDAEFLNRLYIPGLRRAGDLVTAASMARGTIVVHDAGERFAVPGVEPRASKLTPREIVTILRKRAASPAR
jgi:hypothetical protein